MSTELLSDDERTQRIAQIDARLMELERPEEVPDFSDLADDEQAYLALEGVEPEHLPPEVLTDEQLVGLIQKTLGEPGVSDDPTRAEIASGGSLPIPDFDPSQPLGETGENLRSVINEFVLPGAGSAAGAAALVGALPVMGPLGVFAAGGLGAIAGGTLAEGAVDLVTTGELDEQSLAQSAMIEAALPVVGPVALTAAKLPAKGVLSLVKSTGRLLEKFPELVRAGKEVTSGKEFLDLVASVVGDRSTLRKALDPSLKELSEKGQLHKEVPMDFDSILKRLDDDDFFKEGAESFSEIHAKAEAGRIALKERIPEIVSEVSDSLAKRLKFSELGLPEKVFLEAPAGGQRATFQLKTGTDAQVDKALSKQLKNFKLKILSDSDEKTYRAAERHVRVWDNLVLRYGSETAALRKAVGGQEAFDRASRAADKLSELESLIDNTGFSFQDLFRLRADFGAQGSFSSSKDVVDLKKLARVSREVHSGLKRAEQRIARKVSPELADELQKSQTKIRDFSSLVNVASHADSSLKRPSSAVSGLGFGGQAVVRQTGSRAVSSSKAKLRRYRFSEQLRGNIEPGGLISSAAVSTVQGLGELVHKSVPGLASAIEIPSEILGRSVSVVRNFSRDVSKWLGAGPISRDFIERSLVNAEVLRQAKDSSLDLELVDEASAGVLSDMELRAQLAVSPLVQELEASVSSNSEEAVSSTLSKVATLYPEVFERSQSDIPGEVVVNKERRLPDPTDRLLYSNKLLADKALSKRQRVLMRNSAHKGIIIPKPTGKRRLKTTARSAPADLKLDQ